MKNIKEKKCKNCKGRGLVLMREGDKGLTQCPVCKGSGVAGYKQGFKDGAELGYNKANKWHDLRKNPNDLPPKRLEYKQLLLNVRDYSVKYLIAYYMIDGYWNKNGKHFYLDLDCDSMINLKYIIAWKEIVPPETNKEKKNK